MTTWEGLFNTIEAFFKSQIFGTICALGAWVVCYISSERQHNRTAHFDTALSKVYDEIKTFVECANKLKNNINQLPIECIQNRNAAELDKLITLPLAELSNSAVMIEMFFRQKERAVLNNLVEVAKTYNYNLHMAFLEIDKTKRDTMNGVAVANFNKNFDSAFNEVIKMIHSSLLGKWQS